MPPILLVPYDSQWPEKFESEVARLRDAAGNSFTRIEHIGSTAVPGLLAKPVIDIMATVKNLQEDAAFIEPLARRGWAYISKYEVEMPERRFFRKSVLGKRSHHLHVVEKDSEFWTRHLAFRDYLRTHHESVIEYARLKKELAEKFKDDAEAYTEAKSGFIRDIEAKALA